MSRIEQTLKQLKTQGRKALIPYVMAGFPHANSTPEVMHRMVDAGADIINDVWAMRWRGDSLGASPRYANAAEVIARHG